MPTVNIDGKDIEFEGKHYLLQFTIEKGIEIPYFCYHPAMSIPTNCRMCLVEVGFHEKDRATGEFKYDDDGNPSIRWGRKPSTACNTPVVPGMFVKTHRTSEQISTAQKGVLEYMLINHPLDCPICDQAGECPLQIWTYKYGPEGSRFEAQKGHKRKRVELGPNVMLDEERCINCTRCTRFTSEISESHQLTIIGRGEKNYPGTPPGITFDDPYSMNTVDICPVGALTSRQHRFNARVWEMSYSPSIDMNDSTGTNIYVWLRDNKVMRITPRTNMEVNDHWMPDEHRLNVDRYNEHRVSGIKVKGDFPIAFEEGIEKAAKILEAHKGNILFLGSPYASLESNYAFQLMAKELGSQTIYYVPNIIEGRGDGWLMQDDTTPNAKSCEWLGFEALTIEEVKEKINSQDIHALYSLENDVVFDQFSAEEMGKIMAVVHATQWKEAFEQVEVLLPAATAIEAEGVYVNGKNLPQATVMSKQIKQMSSDMWMRLPKARIDKAAVAVDRWRNLDNIFDVLPSWLLSAKIGNSLGIHMPYELHKDIYPVLQAKFELLKDLTFSYRPSREAFKYTQLEYANRWGAR